MNSSLVINQMKIIPGRPCVVNRPDNYNMKSRRRRGAATEM